MCLRGIRAAAHYRLLAAVLHGLAEDRLEGEGEVGTAQEELVLRLVEKSLLCGFLSLKGRIAGCGLFGVLDGVAGDNQEVVVVEFSGILHVVLLLGELNVLWERLVELRHQDIGEVDHSLVE